MIKLISNACFIALLGATAVDAKDLGFRLYGGGAVPAHPNQVSGRWSPGFNAGLGILATPREGVSLTLDGSVSRFSSQGTYRWRPSQELSCLYVSVGVRFEFDRDVVRPYVTVGVGFFAADAGGFGHNFKAPGAGVGLGMGVWKFGSKDLFVEVAYIVGFPDGGFTKGQPVGVAQLRLGLTIRPWA